MKVTINIPEENLKQALTLLVVQHPDVCDIIPALQKTESVEVTEEDVKEFGLYADAEDTWKQVLVALAMLGYGAAMKDLDLDNKEPEQ